jgi:predicted YcjX-like family ATPase
MRHFKDTSTLYLEIVDYPGEWLLDLPMLAQDYLSWSRQMTGLLQGHRAEWSAKWRQLCEGLDPLAPADENRLAAIAEAWTIICISVSRKGCILFSRGVLSCRAIWRVRLRCSFSRGRTWTQSESQTGAGG